MILMIDNYDSFTYILVQYFEELGEEVLVWKHDEHPASHIDTINPTRIIISPGPGGPLDAGISLEAIKLYHTTIPILGVCLGHQCLGYFFGSTICHAPTIMHGKTSTIAHDSSSLFLDTPSSFIVTRYHSLVIAQNTIPECIKQTAWTFDGDNKVCMAIAHKEYPLFGVQFHPESFLSEHGKQILNNFLTVTSK
ncbi:MAG: aminodeoxychorismate/anthranilate synthase component II [Methylacidiphilales bacterium]|nr:aminodeoxychorismate/anthranilate synthase component II [Candidatus Methylacidiphilales bacterium]